VIVRHVLAHEAERLKALRLREDPQGFSRTYEREAALAEDRWTSRAALSERMYAAVGFAPAREQDGLLILRRTR
jgi:hypothetical protein